jgi:hypothetical protein
MAHPNRIPQRNWTAVAQTSKLTAFTPFSGYGQYLPDETLDVIYLEPGAPDTELGKALLRALNESRFIHPDDEPTFFKEERASAAYEAWHENLLKRGTYETEKDAYAEMRYCLATRTEGKISIQPHAGDPEPRYWVDLPESATVIIPATSDPALLGAALTLALRRCQWPVIPLPPAGSQA